MVTESTMDPRKLIHTLILDSGPILKNEPAVSTLVGQAEVLIAVPAVVNEIRDAAARSRLENTLLPFLMLRDPRTESLRTVADFARRTGDYEVLSRVDLQVLALAYEMECERNGGGWRLRKVPGQKRVNGPAPKRMEDVSGERNDEELVSSMIQKNSNVHDKNTMIEEDKVLEDEERIESSQGLQTPTDELNSRLDDIQIFKSFQTDVEGKDHSRNESVSVKKDENLVSDDELEGEGWITPSNIKTRQMKDQSTSSKTCRDQGTMQVATITTDFAMQNVLLQMNLNLVSSSLQRIRHLKTYILRCHACFAKTKDMTKQFCPRCGQPTMMRVSCSTLENGEFRMHLKKNMQWNTRGDRYSIPKPVSGSANGRVNVGGGGKGGGKGGWGHGLILTEDQKEYQRAMGGARQHQPQATRKTHDLMDQDYLPGILTGERGRAGGRPKVGAGRNVNSRKRR